MQCVQFKLCLLTFKVPHGLAPTYLADLCQPVASVGSRQRLRSATRGDLVISPTVTYFGARSFAVAGPKAWNQLPADIRAIDSVSTPLKHSKDIFVPLTICIDETRRALLIVLPCYGALEIVSVIIIITIIMHLEHFPSALVKYNIFCVKCTRNRPVAGLCLSSQGSLSAYPDLSTLWFLQNAAK